MFTITKPRNEQNCIIFLSFIVYSNFIITFALVNNIKEVE